MNKKLAEKKTAEEKRNILRRLKIFKR